MNIINAISKSTLIKAIIACLLIIPVSSNAAIYMFVEGVKGDVTAQGYEDWIEVTTVQEGMTQTIDLRSGAGGATGIVNVLDTAVVKILDSASPVLRQKITGATSIPKIIISLVRTGDSQFEEYFRIELTNVYLTSISMQAFEEQAPTENVSFTYEKVLWRYTPYDSTGNPGSPIEAGWDIVTNKPI